MSEFESIFPDTRDPAPQLDRPPRRRKIRASAAAAFAVWFVVGMSLCYWLLAFADQPMALPAHARAAQFSKANESQPDWTKIFGPNPPPAQAPTTPAPEPEPPRLIGIVASSSGSMAMIAPDPHSRALIVRESDAIESTDYKVQSIGFDQVELSSPRGTLVLRSAPPGDLAAQPNLTR